MKKYEWLPVESSVINHMVEIAEAAYVLVNGEEIYIADELTLNTGWGERGPEYEVGDDEKGIPDAIRVTWFSYSENRFYHLEEKITKLAPFFENGLYNQYEDSQEPVDYLCFGMAPGGQASLWAQSFNQSQLVQTFNAVETAYNWDDFLDTDKTRKEYIDYIHETHRIDSKEEYNRQDIRLFNSSLNSTFELVSKVSPGLVEIEYFNGERFQYKLDNLILQLEKASIPKTINLSFQMDGVDKFLKIHFDKGELLQLLKSKAKRLIYRMYFNGYDNELKIEAYAGDQNLKLTKIEYEVFK